MEIGDGAPETAALGAGLREGVGSFHLPGEKDFLSKEQRGERTGGSRAK